MVIDSKEELNRFLDVAKENRIGNSWSGLFILGQDITCTGTYASRYEGGNTSAPMGTAAGFNGIFDGRGHTIYNCIPSAIGADS